MRTHPYPLNEAKPIEIKANYACIVVSCKKSVTFSTSNCRKAFACLNFVDIICDYFAQFKVIVINKNGKKLCIDFFWVGLFTHLV